MHATPENRKFRRVPITYQIKLVADDRIIAYPTAVNLSMSGLLLQGRDHLPVGSDCGVAILLGSGEAGRPVVTRGTVVRNDERGMAIAFSKVLDAESQQSLRMLIRDLDPEAETPLGSRRVPGVRRG